MRIALCDDDPREQEQFEKALHIWDPTLNTEKFTDGNSLLEAAKTPPSFDIVFLDIYLREENGIDIAKNLRKISPETGIVFVTSSREHAIDAFSIYAIHYLVKPVTIEGIMESFNRLKEFHHIYRERITFKSGTDTYTVFLDQVCFMESNNHNVYITLSDGRCYKVRATFSELEQRMNSNFLKINRSILVNMEYITQMSKNFCVLQNGRQLPVTIRQSTVIKAKYDDFVFERLAIKKNTDLRGGVTSNGGLPEKCSRIFYTGSTL